MTPEDRLRSSLERMIPPPDEAAGWQQVNRRIIRAHRVRVAMISMAAVVALGLGTAIVGAVHLDDSQRLKTQNAAQTTLPHAGPAPTTIPTFPGSAPASTTPTSDSTPATSTPTGSGHGHGHSTPGTTPGTSAPTSGHTGTTVPGQSGTHGTTVPSHPTPTRPVNTNDTRPVATTTLPATPDTTPTISDADLRSQINSFLAGHKPLVRTVAETHVATHAGSNQLVVNVTLRADATGLADQLIARFGEHVSVIVGWFPYPGGPPPGATCVAAAPSPIGPNTLTATPQLPSVARGTDFSGAVTITNHGGVAMVIGGGTNNAVDLLLSGSNTVVATYDSGALSMIPQSTLNPGASVRIPVSGSTAACSDLGGYSVQPGTYDGRIRLTVGGLERDYRFPVTVTG